MTRAALLLVLVLGCGSVTENPRDGAAGSGGSQAATGAAGGDVHEQTGGAGGELGGRGGAGVDAGPIATGPCAGLCSNPIAIIEPSGHQHMTVTNSPAGSCYAITTTPAYELTFSCADSMPSVCGYSAVLINGHEVNCAGALYVSNFSQPGATIGQDCVQFNDCATSAAVGFY